MGKMDQTPIVPSDVSVKNISRRQMLLLLGEMTAALALAGCSRAEAEPEAAVDPKFEIVEGKYGEEGSMTKKVLVTYATRFNSTAGVAEEISKTLAEQGFQVDLRLMEGNIDLSGYQAVVIGSAVQSGAWLPEAVDFVTRNREKLGKMPVAYFLVCMMATKQDAQSRNFVTGFLEPVRQLVKPVAEGRFTGALVLNQHPFGERLGLRIFLAYLKLKPGDYRDFTAVREWAAATAPLLNAS